MSAPKAAKHEFGKCGSQPCRRWAVVKLQGHARCLKHFEADMAAIGSTTRALSRLAGSVTININRAVES